MDKEQIKKHLDSQVSTDIKTLAAFAVRKTKTEADDQVVDNIDEYIDLLKENFDDIADVNPTDQEAKDALLRLAESVAKLTKTPWDDRAVAVLKAIF